MFGQTTCYIQVAVIVINFNLWPKLRPEQFNRKAPKLLHYTTNSNYGVIKY